ncbi:MAG: hypothetical protein JXB10_00870 [Pirellulales bacterium]|nr:hypothetical protein [Pirellulales bacterium]
MKPLFTVHIGEYLVGAHIEQTYPRWNVWIPSKDTGIDLLLTDSRNQKTVSLQVKFSKDFSLTHASRSPLLQSTLLAAGWWTHDLTKIQKSNADFWVFVLPSFVEKKPSFIILPPKTLRRRLKDIHATPKKRIHSYFWVTKSKRCWETRDLSKGDQELLALDRFSDDNRDFTTFLNAWKQIEKKLK